MVQKNFFFDGQTDVFSSVCLSEFFFFLNKTCLIKKLGMFRGEISTSVSDLVELERVNTLLWAILDI